MNEKIKELAEQAEWKTFSPVGSEEWQKIFAELIVKECASHLNSVGDDYAGIELLEHFGVTE